MKWNAWCVWCFLLVRFTFCTAGRNRKWVVMCPFRACLLQSHDVHLPLIVVLNSPSQWEGGVDISTGVIRLLILWSVSILWEDKFQALWKYFFSSKISPRLLIHWWFLSGPFFFVVIETGHYSHLRTLSTFTGWHMASMFVYLFAAWPPAFFVHFFQCWSWFPATTLPRICFVLGLLLLSFNLWHSLKVSTSIFGGRVICFGNRFLNIFYWWTCRWSISALYAL